MVQELTELKNLVIQALEANKSLANIRAQIRSSVFKVIDSQAPPSSTNPSPYFWENIKCIKLKQHPSGGQLINLVKDYLSFYSADYTHSVFSSEAGARDQIKRDQILELHGLKGLKDKPALAQIIQTVRSHK